MALCMAGLVGEGSLSLPSPRVAGTPCFLGLTLAKDLALSGFSCFVRQAGLTGGSSGMGVVELSVSPCRAVSVPGSLFHP